MPPALNVGGRRREPRSHRKARRHGRRNQRSELAGRLIVAIPALLAVLVLVDAGGIVLVVGLAALGWAAMDELYRLFDRAHPIKLAGLLGLVAVLLAAQYGNQFQVLLVAMALLPLTFLLTLVAPRGGTLGIAVTLLGVWWIALALAHAVLLRGSPHGEAIVIDVLVGTFVGDTGAYLGGRMFGRRSMAPRISPHKTVEGLFIGIAAAILGVLFASLYQDWLPKGYALLLGLAIALAAPLGDLFESYVKREAGVKDSGRLFGPHGGALDRIDAVLFTMVAAYYVWIAVA